MSPISSGIWPWLAVAVLGAAAAWWNAHAPTIFFDIQIMLGGSLAVFALLQFGWAGLLVGAAAFSFTFIRWGHPCELIAGTVWLVWLKVFLDRFNGGPVGYDNGRIVLAAIAYWLLVGVPFEVFFFTQFLGSDYLRAFALGMKEAVTGVINTALGLLLFTLFRLWRSRGRSGVLSARGFVFSTVLLAITIPGILITLVLSEQLKDALLRQHLYELRQFGRAAVVQDAEPASPLEEPAMDYEWRGSDGAVRSSNSALFGQLSEFFAPEVPSRTRLQGLEILKPEGAAAVPVAELQSYWLADFPAGAGTMRVVQPAADLIRTLAYELLLPAVLLLMMLLIFGSAASEFLGRLASRQFDAVMEPLRSDDKTLADLGASKLKELDTMSGLINERTRRLNELTASLDRARRKEKEMEEEQRRSLERKLKTSLTASVVAHEINQPLSAILLQGRSILSASSADSGFDPALKNALRDIVHESDRVVETIKKIKALLRNVETDHEVVDLSDVVRSTMKYCQPLAAQAGVLLVCRGDEHPCRLQGDAGQLQMALTNIVRNAIEATGRNHPGDCGEVLVSMRTGEGAATIVVGDNGPGLSGAEVDELLLRSDKAEGSGLGLYIVRVALENHGGSLQVGPSPLGGAEFRVVLPLTAPRA